MVREQEVTIKILMREDGTVRFCGGGGLTPVNGYTYVRYFNPLHRLVAELFVKNPRPDIFDKVDHIDGNRSNNHYTNLRWVDNQLNCGNRKTAKNVYLFKRKTTQRWHGCFRLGGNQTKKWFDTEAEATEWVHREKKKAWQDLYERKIREGATAVKETVVKENNHGSREPRRQQTLRSDFVERPKRLGAVSEEPPEAHFDQRGVGTSEQERNCGARSGWPEDAKALEEAN